MQNNLTYVRQVQIDPKSLQLMVKESGSREPSYLDSRRGLMKVARENSFMPNVFDSGRLAPIFTDLHRSSSGLAEPVCRHGLLMADLAHYEDHYER